jgi:hypothetical protein
MKKIKRTHKKKKNSELDRENQTIRNDRFNTAANSLKYHLETILNFFIKRHTMQYRII